jgi:hypothetical protein
MAQNVKTVGGLAIASVKTIDALAIASAKTIMGVDNTSGGGPCTNERQSSTGANSGFSFFTSFTRLAVQFTAGASYTNCKIDLPLFKIGTPAAGNLVAAIYSDNGSNLPNVQIGTASDAIDRTTIATSYGDFVSFVNVSAALTNGTLYWVVLTASALDADGSNAIVWLDDGGAPIAAGYDGVWNGLGGLARHYKLFST